ncbi:Ankyrin repeat protein family-like protein [Rhynchospora pubera]|uniref:Ankyrin repeat protein family-like protein n=1 Tax=Rhynchospora pubera TaxID=906938 RepID=A0AAV8HUQ9_9POAL|nr:Ankyrin repeat protein family-like protein [Rhynchospora pubera]
MLDTPFHLAARNGNHDMVSRLIGFSDEMGPDVMKELLRSRNKNGETALHEAARHNCAIAAHLLITADFGIATVVDHQGISPFYLATQLGSVDVVRELVQSSIGTEVPRAYYAGRDGQTVLHAAVLRSKEMTEELLKWKPLLARMPDNSGGTPLHFAASYGYDKIVHVLLKCDYSLSYLCDLCGFFPVHVAAKMGHVQVIGEILKYCPDSDELLDNKERNFLHVAAQEGQYNVVRLVCHTISKHKEMKNAQDNDGNTPLHLAINSGHEMIVERLMRDKEVTLNISNKKGSTPRDQSELGTFKDDGLTPNFQQVNFWINMSMGLLGAYCGSRRCDQVIDDNRSRKDPEKENEKLTSAIQTIGLGSVLIATATFAAAFSMPGGYRADDHHKAGSPTLADKYAFKAFLILDTMAFIFAFHSTMLLMFRGVTSSKPHLKKGFVSRALWYIILASRCTILSFAFAIYVVLSPINKVLGILAILGAILCQYDLIGRDFNLASGVITQRRGWKQVRQNKLPEATLRWSWPALFGYERFKFLYWLEMVFPLLCAGVGPLIIDQAWIICRSLIIFVAPSI